MKNLLAIGVVLAMLCSCNSNDEGAIDETGGSSAVIDMGIQIVIADSSLNDCLSPESSSYLGADFIQGIEVYWLNNGKKLSYSDVYNLYAEQGLISKDWEKNYPEQTVCSPKVQSEENGTIDQNTCGYYFIDVSPRFTDNGIAHTYIDYPNGKEDDIKVQIIENSGTTVIRRIWINDELAYDRCISKPDSESILDTDYYYNATNYPFLESVLDDNGKQIGTQQRPLSGTKVVFIRK